MNLYHDLDFQSRFYDFLVPMFAFLQMFIEWVV